MAVQDKVKSIIAEQLGVKPEEVTPEASFVDDLGADSLDTVELVMALEEEFGIEIPDEDAEKITTGMSRVSSFLLSRRRMVSPSYPGRVKASTMISGCCLIAISMRPLPSLNTKH